MNIILPKKMEDPNNTFNIYSLKNNIYTLTIIYMDY